MKKLSRRSASKRLLAGTAALTAGMPAIVCGAVPQVVVVGGGAGGATAARYLAKDSDGQLEVTLVEPAKHYYSCFFSNLYLGGFRDYASIGHSYDRLARMPSLNVVHEWVAAIDREKRRVRLSSGAEVAYDRLMLSPGIDLIYDALPGYSLADAGRMPHAWKSGTQVQHLRYLVENMKSGGTFVMVAPSGAYRCPPGPYERISMIAHVFKQRNPTAKIVIIDAKEKFSKQALFEAAWERHYPGMVLWLPASMSGGLTYIDGASLTFKTEIEDFTADAATVVPPQRAATIAVAAGLTDDSGWCPIVPSTMQSTFDENIHVLGDASIAKAMPKSAFSAHSQAKVAAASVREALLGEERTEPRFANICWSLLAPDDGIKVGAHYKAGADSIEETGKFISQLGETPQVRARTVIEANSWYASVTQDMFG